MGFSEQLQKYEVRNQKYELMWKSWLPTQGWMLQVGKPLDHPFWWHLHSYQLDLLNLQVSKGNSKTPSGALVCITSHKFFSISSSHFLRAIEILQYFQLEPAGTVEQDKRMQWVNNCSRDNGQQLTKSCFKLLLQLWAENLYKPGFNHTLFSDRPCSADPGAFLLCLYVFQFWDKMLSANYLKG